MPLPRRSVTYMPIPVRPSPGDGPGRSCDTSRPPNFLSSSIVRSPSSAGLQGDGVAVEVEQPGGTALPRELSRPPPAGRDEAVALCFVLEDNAQGNCECVGLASRDDLGGVTDDFWHCPAIGRHYRDSSRHRL